MPLLRNTRTGVPGVVRQIDGLFNQTETVLPAPIVEARSRWANMLAGEPVVESTYDAAIQQATVALYDSTPVKPDSVLRVKDGVLVDLAGVEDAEAADRSAEVTHAIWTRALAWAATEYHSAIDANEDALVLACQQRFADVAVDLYNAVADVPVGFDGQGLTYAAAEIVTAWRTASGAWAEVEVLRHVLDMFLDAVPRRRDGMRKVLLTRTPIVEDARLTPNDGMRFAIEVCRRIDGPDQLWLPTRQQADALAAKLWPPINGGKVAPGYSPGTVVPA